MKRSYVKKPSSVAITEVRKDTGATALGLMDLVPAHHFPAKQARRCQFLDLPAISSATDRQLSSLPPSEPYGARIVLQDLSHTARLIISGLQLRADKTSFIPAARHEIRAFVACRFRYMFDAGSKPRWLEATALQSAELAEACLYVSGFDFEMLVLAWEWVWDNKVEGGRSDRNSFDLAWCRDMAGWEHRLNSKQQTALPELLQHYAARHRIRGSARRTVERIITDAFELERACEYVTGYLSKLDMSLQANWSIISQMRAEVSPMTLLWAVYRPDQVRQGDPCDHAAKGAAALAPLKPRYQSLTRDMRVPYDRCLGNSELGYLIHILFWMLQERTSRSGGLGARNASIIYRLALNMLAWIDDKCASKHLAKRLRDADDSSLRQEVQANGMPSLFGRNPGKSWPHLDRFIADDRLDVLGGDYVVAQVEQELKRKRFGLRDPRRNPLIRASYCPQAWSWQVGRETMLDAWICSHSALQTLDLHYASPWLKRRELETALRFASVMSETPCGPMTDYLFACDIDLPGLFSGRFIGLNARAKAMHLGQKTQISGLPASKKRLNSDVFGARRFINHSERRFRRGRR